MDIYCTYQTFKILTVVGFATGFGLDLLANTKRDESTSETGILRPNSFEIESAVAVVENVAAAAVVVENVAAVVVVVVKTVGLMKSESFEAGRSLQPRSSW